MASFVLLCIISPVHLVIILIFIIICKRSTQTFVKVSTDLKRLNQIAKSPLISTMGELINGSVTIR